MRPISVSTAAFDGYALETAFQAIASAGARYVEPAYIKGYLPFDETAFSPDNAAALAAAADAAGLTVLAVSAHMNLADGDGRAMLARRIGFAGDLGARFLVTNAGPASARAEIAAMIRSALPVLEAAGVVLALENPGHGSGDLIPSATAGQDLVQAIGSPFVRLNADLCNTYTYSGGSADPLQDLLAALPAIAHVHLKDVAEPSADWRFCPIGEGVIGYSPILDELARQAPELPIGIELPLRLERRGRGDPVRLAEHPALEDVIAAVRRSLDFVRQGLGRA
ncbi:sugar phosphate isomerase/epimerase family protein [Chelativorans sp.]|uniref:sugar phosphate isomerase/epimerase family protein n=1 Tax=Chelativorans sp. TaxID=2203393 RepID=UPI002811ACA9|nr:sugar phosphate isomerase/epimerase family protein [Chelativorans sp.]